VHDKMNSASAPSGSDDDNWGISQEKMYSVALLRSLKYAGIKFLRYMIVDMCNNVRCKAVPIDHLLREDGISDGVVLSSSLDHQVSIAIASCAGVPFDQDVVVLESGIDAKQVLPVKPDLLTLRPLPYSPKTALVLGTLHDQYSGSISDLCTRGLLKRVIQDLGANYDLECVSEFDGPFENLVRP
jgi:glutamine synthetase